MGWRADWSAPPAATTDLSECNAVTLVGGRAGADRVSARALNREAHRALGPCPCFHRKPPDPPESVRGADAGSRLAGKARPLQATAHSPPVAAVVARRAGKARLVRPRWRAGSSASPDRPAGAGSPAALSRWRRPGRRGRGRQPCTARRPRQMPGVGVPPTRMSQAADDTFSGRIANSADGAAITGDRRWAWLCRRLSREKFRGCTSHHHVGNRRVRRDMLVWKRRL